MTAGAFVSQFNVIGFGGKDNATVNEGNSVMFRCQATGRPTPNVNIYFKDKQMSSISHTNESFYQIANISCDDTGLYTCKASNMMNVVGSTAQLHLFVKCKL